MPGTINSQNQLEEWAFNPYGHGIRHGIKNRNRQQVINAQNITSHGIRNVLSKPENLEKMTLRENLTFTETELFDGEEAQNLSEFVVVGLTLCVGKIDEKKITTSNITMRDSVGLKVPSGEYKPEEEEKHNRLFVVAPIKRARDKNFFLYALLDCDKELFKPYVVKQDEVFYFAEWRNNATKLPDRKRWNENVKNFIEQISGTDEEYSDSLQRSSEFRGPWMHTALQSFMEGADDLSEAKLFSVYEEIAKLFPDLYSELDVNILATIHQGIREARIKIEWQFLRGFLACSCWKYNKCKNSPAKLAQESYEAAKNIVAHAMESMQSVSDDNATTLAEVNKEA